MVLTKIINIHFHSVKDFKNRICQLWQNQKDDEKYVFSFEDKETEDAFEHLTESFNCTEKSYE